MSRYNVEFPFDIAFPPQAMTNVLAEWLGKQEVKQCHIAGMFLVSRSISIRIVLLKIAFDHLVETEKYAHVTFFFNGGLEKQFPGEERVMIPSPKVWRDTFFRQ